MNTVDIINEVQEILREVTDNPGVIITDSTVSDDVEGWDSLAHIQLIVALENKFNISFTAEEIGSYNNIGGMCRGIEKKLGN